MLQSGNSLTALAAGFLDQLSEPQDYYSGCSIALIKRQHFCLPILVLHSGFRARIDPIDMTLSCPLPMSVTLHCRNHAS
jgi:hypothetical protein